MNIINENNSHNENISSKVKYCLSKLYVYLSVAFTAFLLVNIAIDYNNKTSVFSPDFQSKSKLSDVRTISSAASSVKQHNNETLNESLEKINEEVLKEKLKIVGFEAMKDMPIPPLMMFSINDLNNYVGDLFSRMKGFKL